MIQKQELLRILQNALAAEEKAIPIYMKHLSSAIFWTGIDADRIKKAKKLLSRLAEGSTYHKKVVGELIEKIEKENKNAF